MQKFTRALSSLIAGALLLAGVLAFASFSRHEVRAAGGMFFVTPAGGGDCSQAAPCALPTALAQAADGSTLYLAAGTYTGTGGAVLTLTQSLNVYGGWDGSASGAVQRNPAVYVSVLDGENARRGVFVSGGVTVTLDGLHITRGNATGLGGGFAGAEADAGGGVYVYTSTLTIDNCRIYSNTATTLSEGYGGGVYARSSHLTLTASTVQSNTAGTGGTYSRNYGGGIALEYSPYAWIQENTIAGNRASLNGGSWNYGGGVAFLSSEHAVLLTNTLQGNAGTLQGPGSAYGGGAGFWHSGYARIQGNTFLENLGSAQADGSGGGVTLDYSPHVTVTQNTFDGNVAAQGARTGGYGGGLSAYSQFLLVQGNTFAHNVACTGTRCDGEGGGANVSGDDAIIRDNRFVENTASQQAYGYGGGLELQGSGNVLDGNLFQDNVATLQGEGYGGGLALWWVGHTVLDGNILLSNTATLSPTAAGAGGGMDVHYGQALTFTNNVLVANQANTAGGGFSFQSNMWHPGSAILRHTTIADNVSPSGVSLSAYTTLVFTNTILSGHSVGITVTSGSTSTLNATLWNNTTNWGGGGTILT
ncbi:MAG: hypothetical protein D6755_07080, partial [Anaerolineae bacterium]